MRAEQRKPMRNIRAAVLTLEQLSSNSIWRVHTACVQLHRDTLARIRQQPTNVSSCTPEAIARLLSSLSIVPAAVTTTTIATTSSSSSETAEVVVLLGAPSNMSFKVFAQHVCELCQGDATPCEKSLRHLSLAKQYGKYRRSLSDTIDAPSRIAQLDSLYSYKPPATFYPCDNPALEETARLLQQVLSHGISFQGHIPAPSYPFITPYQDVLKLQTKAPFLSHSNQQPSNVEPATNMPC